VAEKSAFDFKELKSTVEQPESPSIYAGQNDDDDNDEQPIIRTRGHRHQRKPCVIHDSDDTIDPSQQHEVPIVLSDEEDTEEAKEEEEDGLILHENTIDLEELEHHFTPQATPQCSKISRHLDNILATPDDRSRISRPLRRVIVISDDSDDERPSTWENQHSKQSHQTTTRPLSMSTPISGNKPDVYIIDSSESEDGEDTHYWTAQTSIASIYKERNNTPPPPLETVLDTLNVFLSAHATPTSSPPPVHQNIPPKSTHKHSTHVR
jgi:hypothetical protein